MGSSFHSFISKQLPSHLANILSSFPHHEKRSRLNHKLVLHSLHHILKTHIPVLHIHTHTHTHKVSFINHSEPFTMKTSFVAFLTLLPCVALGAVSRHHAHRHQSRNSDDNACMTAFNAWYNNCRNVELKAYCMDFVAYKSAYCQGGAPPVPGPASVVTTTSAWTTAVPTTSPSGAAFIETSGGSAFAPGSGDATYHADFSQNACNIPSSSENELVTSIRSTMFTSANPNLDPICGKYIRVHGNGRSINVKVIDKYVVYPHNPAFSPKF